MVTEFAIAGIITFGIDRIRNREFYKAERTFRQTCMLENKSFKIKNTWLTNYGVKFLINLKNNGYGDLERLRDLLEINFSARVEMEQNVDMGTAYVYVLSERLNDLEFKFTPYEAKPNEIYLGLDNRLQPIIVNMNTFPHVLLSGTPGSGKSEELKIIISNLIASNSDRDINLHFSNISLSNDFYQFLNCKQVKSYVEKIEESLELFKYLNHVYEKRLNIFRKHNCLDIKDYNNKFEGKKMNYNYLIVDEFADYFPQNKHDKEYLFKTLCYNELKHLARKGRKTGIFLVICLQRPDTSVLCPSLRSNLCTKVCFAQNNDASSLTACDTTELTNVKEREFLMMCGNKRVWSRSLYLDKQIIHNAIKGSIYKNNIINKFLKTNKDEVVDKVKVYKKGKSTVKNIEIIKLS